MKNTSAASKKSTTNNIALSDSNPEKSAAAKRLAKAKKRHSVDIFPF